MNPQKIASVLALDAPKRYAHFIKVCADQRKMWGLYQNGWALAESDTGEPAFPVWPAREYAVLCAVRQWEGYEPREIDLDTFFENLVPSLLDRKTILAVFPKPDQKGITPWVEEVIIDLRAELSKIE
ncbi:MAG: DUF2750 domain-containing protein [Kiritimatiellae bacterium]|nr:DUF2750 domain-containing protein [Kiritimatiellia bacterium]